MTPAGSALVPTDAELQAIQVPVIVPGPVQAERMSDWSVKGYLECGFRWWLVHARGFKTSSSSALVLGSAFHNGMQFANLEQIAGRPRPEPARIAAAAVAAITPEIAKAERDSGVPLRWLKGDDLAGIQDRAARMVWAHELVRGHLLHPLRVEGHFSIPLENRRYQITGRSDLYEDGVAAAPAIEDYKTSRKALDPSIVRLTPQLDFYQLWALYEDLPLEQLRIVNVIAPVDRRKDVEVQVLAAPARTPERLARSLERIDQVAKGIEAGVFPKVAKWETCRYCDFRENCQPELTGPAPEPEEE